MEGEMDIEGRKLGRSRISRAVLAATLQPEASNFARSRS